MKLNNIEKGILLGLSSLLILSSCTPSTPDSTPIKPISSPIPALISPTEISTPNVLPTIPLLPPTPEPTKTVQESMPVYSDRGTMISSDGKLTASVPDSALDLAGINNVSTSPENLTKARKYMLVTWAAEMAKRPDLVSSIQGLKNFVGMTYDKPLDVLLKAFDDNAKLGTSGFQFEFDFGNKVKGKVDNIDIKTTSSEAEWQSVINNAREEKIPFNIIQIPVSQIPEKSLILFDQNGKLKVYQNNGNIERLTVNRAYGNYFTGRVFASPTVDLQFIISKISNTDGSTGNGTIGVADKLYEIFNCADCTATSLKTGAFVITK